MRHNLTEAAQIFDEWSNSNLDEQFEIHDLRTRKPVPLGLIEPYEALFQYQRTPEIEPQITCGYCYSFCDIYELNADGLCRTCESEFGHCRLCSTPVLYMHLNGNFCDRCNNQLGNQRKAL